MTADAGQEPTAAGLSALAVTLADSLAVWASRDGTAASAGARSAANDACDAIDLMLGDLHRMRARLLDEARAFDDATAVRVDALIARLRSERGQ